MNKENNRRDGNLNPPKAENWMKSIVSGQYMVYMTIILILQLEKGAVSLSKLWIWHQGNAYDTLGNNFTAVSEGEKEFKANF